MSNKELPFGIDVSSHQGIINWDVIAAHEPKVEFVGIRAGISWGYTDKWFSRNWSEAKRVNILRTAYHVLYHGEDSTRQMDAMFKIIGNDLGELPITLDCELDHGLSKDRITKSILECADIIKTRTGRDPIIYSRASWIDAYTLLGDWRNRFDWWLAHYLNSHTQEHPGPPIMPKGVDRERVIIHQTGTITPSFGVESKELDFDRWQSSLICLQAYANQPITMPKLTDHEKVDKLWKAHPELH